jgi:hypothetical protein
MHIGMSVVVDFPAAQTRIAAIGGHAAGFDRLLAVQRFGQRAGESFQFFELIAGEQVGVAQPSAGERALKQLDAPRLFRKKFEGHARLRWKPVGLLFSCQCLLA